MTLKSTFLAFKKVVQVIQIGGKGGTKSKRTAVFFRDFVPNGYWRSFISYRVRTIKDRDCVLSTRIVVFCVLFSVATVFIGWIVVFCNSTSGGSDIGGYVLTD